MKLSILKLKEKENLSTTHSLELKGVAIIMLIFYHCFRKATAQAFNVSFYPFDENIMINLISTFKICVSIFVFITGYGLTLSLKKINEDYKLSKEQLKQWLSTRLVKTLSGFWILAILAYIICQIIDGRTSTVFFSDGIFYGIVKIIIDFFGLSDLFGINEFCTTWWYMSVAILYIFSIPLFARLFKKFGYMPVLMLVIALPRVIGWEYTNSGYFTFLCTLLVGMIAAEKNLVVRIANFKILKNNTYLNKFLKFIFETVVVILLFIIYYQLPSSEFWEIRYAVIPFLLICYLYEFFLDLPIFKQILAFLGKHSMNIFLIHTFFRAYYLQDYIYSFGNFIVIAIVLLGLSVIASIILEGFKKLIRYDKLISKLNFSK